MRIDIVPNDKTFAIWGIIYMWQISWIIYSVFATVTGHAGWCPKEVYLAFSFLTVINVIWLLVWDRELLFLSAVVIAIMPLTTWYGTHEAYKNFQYQGFADDLAKQLNAGLLVNGLAFYATWVSIATIINNTTNIALNLRIDQHLVCHFALVALGGVIYYYEHYSTVLNPGFGKLIWSPYLVLFWASWGVFARQEYKVNNSLRVMVIGVFAWSIWLLYNRFKVFIPILKT